MTSRSKWLARRDQIVDLARKWKQMNPAQSAALHRVSRWINFRLAQEGFDFARVLTEVDEAVAQIGRGDYGWAPDHPEFVSDQRHAQIAQAAKCGMEPEPAG